MVFAYGITALISLCMVGLCVAVDKKRDVWLVLLFVSVAVCNLGYFMLSISKDLADALNSNRISYLGSVFLPFFLLMMVLRFCGIKRQKTTTVLLAGLGIVMLAITTSPGISTVYYSSVAIVFEEGATKLVREYGPLHAWYYVYLLGYMFSMIAVSIYSVWKKKITSRFHTVLLLCAVFCNIVIWLAEQFLPRGFEWLSVSYILTECLILVIYHSMQRLGLMDPKENTYTYTINVLLAIFALLFANFIRVVSKDTTPDVYVLSHVCVLLIYVSILVSWGISVHERIVNKNIRRYLVALVGLMLTWMLMRTLRFTVFYHVFPMGQWCWYAYYISMILIPQLCFMAAKHIGKHETYSLQKRWHLMYIPSAVLIIGILTNDLHQQAFRFHMGYQAGWDVYERGVMYYAAVVWIFFCIVMTIKEIFKNCRVPGSNRTIWMPIAMLGIGVLYSVLYAIESDLFGFVEMTAALCFTVVAIWESSIKTGLIQSNTHYDELLKNSGLGVSVVDSGYTVYYRSEDALPLTSDQIKQIIKEPILLENGIRVSGSEIRGGYSLWQEDISELLGILEKLQELQEELKDSNAASIQNYRMQKQFRVLVERNRLHDELHRQTAHQMNLMSDWLGQMLQISDPEHKRKLLQRIVVVGAYLKRRNNLILVGKQDGVIREEELRLSIEEMMRNLQLAGVDCACIIQFDRDIPTQTGMELFDFYEYVVEHTFDGLTSLLVRFFIRDGDYYACIDTCCKQDMTGLQSEKISVSILDENCYTLSYCVSGGERK